MLTKPFIKTAVEQNVSNTVAATVIGDWTMTRYTDVTNGFPQTNETDVQEKDGRDLGYPSYFPISKVTQPFRDPGVIYSTSYNGYGNSYSGADVLADTTSDNVRSIKMFDWNVSEVKRTNNRTNPRCYLAGKDNSFQYWISSARTLAATDANGRTAGQFSCTPVSGSRALFLDIEFTTSVHTNKMTLKVNTHIGNPQGLTFWVKKSGTWTQVASGINVPNSGLVEVWRTYDGTTNPGTWTQTPAYYTAAADNAIQIDGIRVGVDSMLRTLPGSGTTETAKNASLEVIEFTPRLSVDLSDRTRSYSASVELGNNDVEFMVGNVSSNTGSINFINDDGFFDTDTGNAILRGRLDEFVELTVDVVYDSSIGGTTAERTARQITMLSEDWTGTNNAETTVGLADYSKVLQEAMAQETLVKDIPAYAVIWLLCDGVGFNRVDVKRSTASEDELMLEYFWTDGNKSVWELIQEIAHDYQLAVYFDYNGRLQVVTRKYLFDRNSVNTEDVTPDFTMYGETNGALLSGLITTGRQEGKVYDKATVTYKAINAYNYAKSRNSIVWKAPDPLVLGAAQIVQSFSQGATQIKIDPNFDDSLFGYHGKFVIEDTGRIFEYTAKKYQFLNSNTTWVKNDNDMLAAIETNNGVRPTFTGWIQLATPTGGGLDSVVYDFRQNWQCMKFAFNGTIGQNDFSPTKFIKYDRLSDEGGALSITTSFNGNSRYKIWKKTQTYDKYDRVGIKFKMVSGADQAVGVVLFPQGANAGGGYHVTVMPNNSAGDGDKVKIIRVKTDGGEQALEFNPEGGPVADAEIRQEGFKSQVTKGRWYYLEAVIFGTEKDWKISVFVNGEYYGTWFDSSDGALARTQKAQFFVQGDGRVLIDRFYVANTRGKKTDRLPSWHNVGRKDLLYNRKLCPTDKQFNQYINDYLKKRYDARVWVYNFNSAGWATAKEIRHFTADFEKPALRQWIYCRNKNADVGLYNKMPMGAKFTLKNATERNQLLQGTRETKVSGASHNESTFIFAKSFTIQDEQKIEYKDADLINRLGENAIEFTSDWLQSAEAAESVADFIRSKFGIQGRIWTAEIYGNPLVEVGDIVAVYWPNNRMSSYTYLVTSVTQGFDNGLSSNVTLLQRQNTPAKEVTVPDTSIEIDLASPPRFYQISASNI